MSHKLPEGYHVRPATLNDLDASVKMFNACSRQMLGVEKFTLADVGLEWKTPGFNLATDTRLVISPDGKVAGYYEVWDLDDPHVRLNCWGRVHPEHTGLGIGSLLLDWAQERANQAIAKAPQQARVTLLAFCLSGNDAAQDLFRQTGFKLIRHSLRMVINMNGQPPMAEWPEGITVRSLVVDQDERAVVHAVRDAFKDHWGYVEHPFEDEFDRWSHFMNNDENFDPSLWYLAMDGEEIAGISLCSPKTDDDLEMGWVNTLGVRRPWRRRGVGLGLLNHSFRAFYQRGKRKVGLGVDAQSLTGATRLYLRAGMQPDPTRQFSLFEKELRPGHEISTQDVEAE